MSSESSVPSDETVAAVKVEVDTAPTIETKPKTTKIRDTYSAFPADAVAKVRYRVKDVPMSRASREEYEEQLMEYAKSSWNEATQDTFESELEAYSQGLLRPMRGHWGHDEYNSVFDREDAEWQQRLDCSKGAVGIKRLNVSTKGKAHLKGAAAVTALQTSLGMGGPGEVQCVHSGITITFGNFKLTEMLTISNILISRRMDIGYDTAGYLISGGDVKLTMDLLDFCLSHAMSTNIKGWMQGDLQTLKSLLLATDIHSIFTACLESIYPGGYPSIQRCKNEGTTCTYSTEEQLKASLDGREFDVSGLIYFRRMHFIDGNSLTLDNRNFMMEVHTGEEILAYQESVNRSERKVIVSGGDVDYSLYLKIPHVDVYESRGNHWVNGVVNMVNVSLNMGEDLDGEERETKRNEYMVQYQKALTLSRHACWIESVQFKLSPDDDEVITVSDVDTIGEYLEQFSADEEMESQITGLINNYREDVQFSFTGFTNYECPKCGESQAEGIDKARGIIPVNVVDYFLDLMVWRREQHMSRKTSQGVRAKR